MTSIQDIKKAIEGLSVRQTLELAEWLDERCLTIASTPGTKAPESDDDEED